VNQRAERGPDGHFLAGQYSCAHLREPHLVGRMTFTHSNVPWPGCDARYDMDEEWVLVDVDGPAMVPSPPSGPREARVSAPSFALDEAKMDEDMAPPPTDEPAVASAVAPSNHLEHEHKLALMEVRRRRARARLSRMRARIAHMPRCHVLPACRKSARSSCRSPA